MSTPASNLRKSYKSVSLLPGSIHNSLPTRKPVYSDDESKLLSEISTSMAQSRIKLRDPFTGGIPKAIAHPRTKSQDSTTPSCNPPLQKVPNDHDLMMTMMKKLSLLEEKTLEQHKIIQEKDKKIRVLEEKLDVIQRAKADEDDFTKTRELETKCLLLKQQVYEMENFLEDYGMIWVGEQSNTDSDVYYEESTDIPDSASVITSSADAWQQSSTFLTSVPQQDEFVVDYNLVIKNVEELNVLAGEGVAKIQHTADGARLKMPDPVPLTLYANGIVMFSGPFRPFTDEITQMCIKDLMDGYFPSELQSRYPDGIPFKLTDLREIHFKDKRHERIFEGQGQMLGGETKPSRLVPSNLDRSTLTDRTDETIKTSSLLPGPRLTVEQFVKHLPSSVVKNGKVINIRNAIQETLQGDGKKTDVTLVDTSAVQEMRNRMENGEGTRPKSARDVATLRVKSLGGDHTYIVKMRFKETIGDLRRYLNLHSSPGSTINYDVVTAFPNRIYSDDSATLESCDLVPNANLHLRRRK